ENFVRAMIQSSIHTYTSHLVHELQHAYDDWRSNGKAIVTDPVNKHSTKAHRYSKKNPEELTASQQQFIDTYNKKKQDINSEYHRLSRKQFEDLTEEESTFIGKQYNKYLNQKHEIDARFAQAFIKLPLCDWDFDASLDANKNIYFLMPFKDALRK